jgi:glycerate kinase
MKILIASDSFKDALPALKVCEAMARGARRACPDADIALIPLADGGEGTAEIMTYHAGGRWVAARASDPLGRPIEACYGLSPDGSTAYIDMAQASGLPLLAAEERDPERTSTRGTGELILDAWRRGARRIYLGIGGSATNDGGAGMAAALGYQFLDAQGQTLEPRGGNLGDISRIEADNLAFAPGDVEVVVLCDVDNPLFGEQGAARVYGPQKGADVAMVARLDEGLRRFAQVLQRRFEGDHAGVPGAGAAGGMGAGALAFLGATLRPGIDTIMDHSGFDKALVGAQLVFTGEGRLDGQTLRGKLIHGVCRRAQAAGAPVIALCGASLASLEQLETLGLAAAFAIVDRPATLEEAIARSAELLEASAWNALRIFLAGRRGASL